MGVRIEGKCDISRKLRLEHYGSSCMFFLFYGHQKGMTIMKRFLVTIKMEMNAPTKGDAESLAYALFAESVRPQVKQINAEHILPVMEKVSMAVWNRVVQYGTFTGKDELGMYITLEGRTYCWRTAKDHEGPHIVQE